MDLPVFIRCEKCNKVYQERYVLVRNEMFITEGICDYCIVEEYHSGKITRAEAIAKLNERKP